LETYQEEEPDDYYSSRRASARHRFEEDLEAEAQAERRIINAKRVSFSILIINTFVHSCMLGFHVHSCYFSCMDHQSNVYKNVPRKTSLPARPSKRPVDSESEREESEYETDGEDIERSPAHAGDDLPDHEDEYEDEEEDEEAAGANSMSEEEEEVKLLSLLMKKF